jgi:hypothetical protein
VQVNFFTRTWFFGQCGKMFLPLKVFQKRYRFQISLKILAKIRRMRVCGKFCFFILNEVIAARLTYFNKAGGF